MRNNEVAVNKVARWERVCDTCDVWACVGGNKSGSGPKRRAEERGPWVVR